MVSDRLRCFLVWLAATAVAGGLLLLSVSELARAHSAWVRGTFATAPVDHLLAWAAAAVLSGCVAWLWVMTSVVTAAAARGAETAGPPGCPAALRRVLLAACGVAVAGSLIVPAHAGSADPTGTEPDPPAQTLPPEALALLEGIPLPDRAVDAEGTSPGPHLGPSAAPDEAAARASPAPGRRPASRHPAPAPTRRPAAAESAARPTPVESTAAGRPPPRRPVQRRRETAAAVAGVHVVVSGDTLWDIAVTTLPPGATSEHVARRWQEIYATNRSVIGPDPDLIRPDQHLRLPGARPRTDP
jgi:hypothetical protein